MIASVLAGSRRGRLVVEDHAGARDVHDHRKAEDRDLHSHLVLGDGDDLAHGARERSVDDARHVTAAYGNVVVTPPKVQLNA